MGVTRRRWWPFGRRELVLDHEPRGNSPQRGWRVTERVVREAEADLDRLRSR